MNILTPEEAREIVKEKRVEIYTHMIATAINAATERGYGNCEVEFDSDCYDSRIVKDILRPAGYAYISQEYAFDENAPLAYFYDDDGECCTYTTVTVTIHWGQ